MNPRWRRWLRYVVLGVLALVSVALLILQSGLADRWARVAIVRRIMQMTGGQVELGAFRFHWTTLRAELTDLTIHGSEPPGTPPFFHADALVLDLHVVSFLRRKVTLDELRLDRPAVHVRFDARGRSNVPAPRPAAPASVKPWRDRIFDLAIGKLRLQNGELLFNDVRIPLVVEGGQFNFTLDYFSDPGSGGRYVGALEWSRMLLAARRYLPFPSDAAAKFTFTPKGFVLDELRWKLPHTDLVAGASLENFAQPAWAFRFQGEVGLEDVRTLLRKPNSPDGRVGFSGEGRYARGEWTALGRYAAHEISMPYRWFHADGIESHGEFRVASGRLELPRFEAVLLGGKLDGRMEMQFNGLKFRVESTARGLDLARLLEAVENENFPVRTFHWAGRADVDAVTTWQQDFKSVAARGVMHWTPPPAGRDGEIPVRARFPFDFAMDRGAVDLDPGEIVTSSSRVEMHGRLGARDSNLQCRLVVHDLLPWNDFINHLRGAEAQPVRIAGRAEWTGTLRGPLGGPTFAGHVTGYQAAYGRLYWDTLEGDLTYSPVQLRFERARATRGRSAAALSLWLELDGWGFWPGSDWKFDGDFARADFDDLQALFGTAYPAHGLLTGSFRGSGTRRDPQLKAQFDFAPAEGWGFQADRFRGRFSLTAGEIQISDAEILRAGARIAGNFHFVRATQLIDFDFAGVGLPLEKIDPLQSERIRLGGTASFDLKGHGPIGAPQAQGRLRVSALRVGEDTLGDLDAQLRSDGRQLRAELSSAMAARKVAGRLEVTLGSEYPLHGDLSVEGMDFDTFIVSALRLRGLTGHSRVDGRFLLSGWLARPETLTVEADISRLVFDYQFVKLENAGPIRLAYRREEVRVDQAHLRGPETDFAISGVARFTGDRRVDLKLGGSVNLRLLGGFWPALEARGAAQVNTIIEGTLASPRITGRIHVENAAANYGDFPAGLSQVTGDFVFDHSRLLFENVGAQAGGGRLTLAGSLTYGEGPVRYDLVLAASRVRLRYPLGISWLAGGTVRLSGGLVGALLSGRVEVDRVFMAPGFDLMTLLGGSRDAVRAPTTTSPFLRSLQFDVEAVSTPAARMEWSGARFDTEAGLRVRGTWEHPILLGHIHLLNGEMSFRGNRYRLTRGDLNFSNPFRLDPILNLEATTTIRQYEIAVNFTGPASRLTLAYRSAPPLPASDIVGLLALGRTGEESELRAASPQGQTAEMGASAMLSEAISSQLSGRIERLFGVSRFKVDPFLAGTGAEQNATARITIEQQVARDLTITYITNVTSTQQQIIQIEYAVNRDVSIIALRDQNGTFGLDVKFKKRFK